MDKEKTCLTLWKDCKNTFGNFKNCQPEDLLKDLLDIVIKNYEVFQVIADTNFLKFLTEMNINDYIVGTNGDDYNIRLSNYAERKELSLEEIWHILSQLIWDLTVPVTNKICPFCQCDNIVLLTDEKKEHLYESCENCFRTTENHLQIMRPNNLYPADKREIVKFSYWPIIIQK